MTETSTTPRIRPGTAPTAGLRGAHWDPSRLPVGHHVSTQVGMAADGVPATGLLYARGGEKTAVLAMHPREFLATHYLVPEVLRAGAAIFLQMPRAIGNDLRLEHETTVFEVGAGVGLLRGLGYEKIVLLGNSGGAPVMALYIQQSLAAPGQRLETTASGRPVALNAASLPTVDGLLLVSAHEGPGLLLQDCIDGSLTDEHDPFSIDRSLSPFEAKNGFHRPPESASYTPAFIERYRAAQKARVARIDAQARAMIEERVAARRQAKDAPSPALLASAAHQQVIQVWRTDADPRCFDLNLDPSDRAYGSVWGANPVASNFGTVGFARLCTPESWLSTWSANSCVASLPRCAPAIEQPTLLVEYTGDNAVFPETAKRVMGLIGAGDKTHVRIPGNHHGASLGRDYPDGRDGAGRSIAQWLQERFPVAQGVI
ncbi:alpha/beta hydrolase [Variovorax sp. JS1663]|uniref:alpha/beta hydrolase n=1 Tax=Variovorax sp. JS1663 TaxID=1851577 RepID=UPI000B3414E2|nr:alpha/beta hydrolase [Variovorax sp. JS1663]OUM02446.1 alpha/beta hydrolase [Variovorax sp. JS1663]OUM02469.1 alpha/beta hydrolase [Variovorax sp. JS1663]